MADHPQGTPGKTSKPAKKKIPLKPRGTNVGPVSLPKQAAARAKAATQKPKPKRAK